jgi:glucosamine--fructose-6-phosphate aminotransferase (isomerizing)
MKSLGKFPDPFIAEIAGQPDALRRAADGLADQRSALGRLAAVDRGRPVIFTGMGSSYHACYPAVTQLASAGIAAIHVDSSELLHFRARLLPEAAALVAVSQSGESAEIVRLLEHLGGLERRPPLVAVTNGTSSSLATHADDVLDTRAGEETGPSTMTFAAALVVLSAVGRVIAGDDDGAVLEDLVPRAGAVAASIEELLSLTALPRTLGEHLGGRETFVILGRGPARAAAEMGALTLKEAASLPIESYQTAQFRHGPLELAGDDLAAIVIATEPATRDLDLGFARELSDAGAAVLVVAEEAETPATVMRIALGPLDHAIAPAASIVPAQLLAWRLAVLQGREPGSYLQAAKVTTRE